MEFEGEAGSEPAIHKKSLTLAEELSHFMKTAKVSSEEAVMAFMIPAIIRRGRAGLKINAAMEPLETLGNAAKPLSLHPLKFENAVAALLKVKPEPKAKPEES